MRRDRHAVILTYSTSHAIRAERVLYMAAIDCKLIPVPRHLSSNCGVAVRIDRADQHRALEVLEENQVEIEGVHEI